MNKINLCDILKKHIGKNFYSPLLGYITLSKIEDNYLKFVYKGSYVIIPSNGCDRFGNLALYPSETELDWIEWDKVNNNCIKTWKDYLAHYDINKQPNDMMIDITGSNGHGWSRRKTKTEYAALALMKIITLIDKGYGGCISESEWKDDKKDKWTILPTTSNGQYVICYVNMYGSKSHLAFHTREQVEEFLKHPENIKLLNDYFMI